MEKRPHSNHMNGLFTLSLALSSFLRSIRNRNSGNDLLITCSALSLSLSLPLPLPLYMSPALSPPLSSFPIVIAFLYRVYVCLLQQRERRAHTITCECDERRKRRKTQTNIYMRWLRVFRARSIRSTRTKSCSAPQSKLMFCQHNCLRPPNQTRPC